MIKWRLIQFNIVWKETGVSGVGKQAWSKSVELGNSDVPVLSQTWACVL